MIVNWSRPRAAEHVDGPIGKPSAVDSPQVLGHISKFSGVRIHFRVIPPNCVIRSPEIIVTANHPDDGASGSHRGTKSKPGHVRAARPRIVRLVVNPRRVEDLDASRKVPA